MSPSEKKARAALPGPTKYTVTLSKKALKSLHRVPETVFDICELLREELATEGPIQPEWDQFSALRRQAGQKRGEKRYHCRLKKGSPTYVACWKVIGKTIEIDIYYLGTHENVPY